jgi:hypothetical protein
MTNGRTNEKRGNWERHARNNKVGGVGHGRFTNSGEKMSMAEKSRPGPSSKSCPRLSPKHRKTLQGYGLNDSTIDAWGCYSVSGADLRARGFAMAVEPPGIALPILPPGRRKAHGFMYKPDNPRQLEKKNGKVRICKYEHAVGALNHVHVPRSVQKKLFDEGHAYPRTLVITEGPIKAEKAAQEGIDCVALLGVWNWRQKFGNESVPIEDLSKIPWGRFDAVEICFDSDAATNPHVRKAELALGAYLQKRGAENVFIVRLPPEEDGSKVGLDDYLRVHSAKDYKKLPRLPLDVEPALTELVANLTPETEKKERNSVLGRIADEEHDPGEQERLLKLSARLTRIPLRALRTSAQAEAARIQAKRRQDQAKQPPLSGEQAREAAKKRQEAINAAVESILNRAHETVTLRTQNNLDGDLSYVTAFGEAGSLFVCATGVMPVTSLPENYRITEPPPDASVMSADGIRRLQNGEEISAVELFKALQNFIGRRVIFTHECIPPVLALWLMGTYCYVLFNYFGYVWLTSLVPGCGKTLVEKILSLVAFSATSPLVDPTPATVFRDIEANCSTFILDEVEGLDPEKKGELLGILNAGFERGAKVRRMIPAGEGWSVKAFDVYGPKVIAGINQIPRPLQTRSFRTEMRKKKNTEEIKPLHPDQLGKWTSNRRDDMAIFALRNAKKIAELYHQRNNLVPQGSRDGKIIFDDRLRDIFAPLYVLADLVDEQAGELVATPRVYDFLKLQAGARDAEGAGDYVLAAHAVWNWAEEKWDGNGKALIQTHEAKTLFAEAEIDWAATELAKTKSLLRKLGGVNASLWWKGKTVRGYVFSKPELQDLVERNPVSAKRTAGEKREDR